MDLAAARKEIETLRAAISRYDDLYYRRATSEISDQQYDALLRRLAALESSYPELAAAGSPTSGVGSDRDLRFPSALHSHPMISLQNSYELADVVAFVRRVRQELPERDLSFTVEPKIDGVALAVRYRGGRLVQALTRGDGTRGDVITDNVRTFAEVPEHLPDRWRERFPELPAAFEVRGEAYLSLSRLAELNRFRQERGEEPLANPRNATAGTLKTLDPSVVAARGLSAFFYQILPLDDAPLGLASHVQEFEVLSGLGFPVAPFLRIAAGAEQIKSHLAALEALRPGLDYQIDGAVLKVDELIFHERLGRTARAPRWGLAFKFAAAEAETRLEAVALQVGRTGVITPVAELHPVHLAGTTVSRATLHNWDEIARKDIRLGDTVVVAKGGDVIPKVLRVVPERRIGGESPVPVPTRCPVCGGPTRREEGQVALRCLNRGCPAQTAGRLRHFVGREAADIEGLGARGIDQLIAAEMVEDPADLFRLQREALVLLPGWGELSADALLASVARAKKRPWVNKIFSLGIPGVGITTARLLAGHFPNIEALRTAAPEMLEAIFGVGPEMARDIRDFFDSTGTTAFIDKLKNMSYLLDVENVEEVKVILNGGWFRGRTVVLTGSFEHWSRSDAKKLVEQRGGSVVGAVSRKTDVVFFGAKPGSKLVKARRLGIPLMDENTFVRLLEGGAPDDDD